MPTLLEKCFDLTKGILFLICLIIFQYTPLNNLANTYLSAKLADIMFPLTTLTFVLLFEGWIWWKRLETAFSLKLLDQLDSEYKMLKGGIK